MKKSGGVLLSMFNLDRQSSTPLMRQLENKIRKAVLDGDLPEATRLPSSRQLAVDLDVSRLTIKNAFEQLTTEGYLESRRGSGTYVARLSSGDLPVPSIKNRIRRDRKFGPVSSQVAQTQNTLATIRLSHVRAFRPGIPALDLFPRRNWADALTRAVRSYDTALLGYGPPSGLPEFKTAIASHVRDSRGIECDADDIIITAGAQQAFALILMALQTPGKEIWMEDPGHIAFRDVARLQGYTVNPVPLDDEGFSLGHALDHYKSCNLMFVTPSHQHPMGITMSLPRRLDLLDVARSMDSWIIEDDYDSAFHYDERPQPALKALDKQGRVFYVGSFSKTMFPAIRLGYLICPPGFGPAFGTAETLMMQSVSPLHQKAMSYFMVDGSFNAHVRRMKQEYRSRRDTLVLSLNTHAGHLLQAEPCQAGMHLVTHFTDRNVPDLLIAQALWDKGIDCLPISVFHDQTPGAPGLLLGFACAPESSIDRKVSQATHTIEAAISNLRQDS